MKKYLTCQMKIRVNYLTNTNGHRWDRKKKGWRVRNSKPGWD